MIISYLNKGIHVLKRSSFNKELSQSLGLSLAPLSMNDPLSDIDVMMLGFNLGWSLER
jgi:hypothetical protein